MDFARIDLQHAAERIVTYHITDPYADEPIYLDSSDKATAVTFDLIGVDSKAGREASTIMLKRIEEKSKRQFDQSQMTAEDIIRVSEQDLEAQAKFIARCLRGWKNVMFIPDEHLDDPQFEAKPLRFNLENAEMLLTKRNWILQKLLGFLQEKHRWRQTPVKK